MPKLKAASRKSSSGNIKNFSKTEEDKEEVNTKEASPDNTIICMLVGLNL